MATLVKTARACVAPVSQTWSYVRLKHKYHSKKPWLHPRSFKFRIFRAVTDPIYLKDDSQPELCPRLNRLQQAAIKENEKKLSENIDFSAGMEEYIFRRCEKVLHESRMVAVCQLLPCSARDLNKYKCDLWKEDMKLAIFSNAFVRRATDGTRLHNMYPWLISYNAYIYGEEPKVPELMKMIRKIPSLALLGGHIDGQLLSKEGFVRYANMPPIEQQRGELCSILNMAAGGRTTSLLSSHQQKLSTNLEQYVRQNKTDQTSED